MLIENILEEHAMHYADKTALISGSGRITYRDLQRRVDALASGLQRQGIGPGDRIVLYLSNCQELVELSYAASSIAAIVVPVAAHSTSGELQLICSTCQPSVIVVDGVGTAIFGVLQSNPDAVWVTTGAPHVGVIEYAHLVVR